MARRESMFPAGPPEATGQGTREVSMLKELVETRLEAMDKGIVLLQAFADKSPTTHQVFQEVMALKDLHGEKFRGIEMQLQSAKELAAERNTTNSTATTKSEAMTTGAITQLLQLFNTTNAAMTERINDMKSRMDKGEGGTTAGARSTDRTSSIIGMTIAGSVAFVVVMGAIIGLTVFVVTRSPGPSPVYLTTPPSAVVR